MKLWRVLPVGTVLVTPLLLVLAGEGLADQFHYNNVLVGTRAVGMGGAFTAVADDASGVYYNPAGLAFALSNDISGSANAFYSKKTVYENTLGSQPFEEDSTGSLSPFFGGLQKLDRFAEGLVFAFGVYYVDGDLKDQDTEIDNKTVGSADIERYHRTSNARAGTYYAGAALGYRPSPNFAVGFGLNYFNADELVQEYQYAKQSVPLTLSNNTTIEGWRILTSNVRQHLQVYGVQPTLGVQAALPAGFTVGAVVKKGFVASQSFDSTSETETTILDNDQNNTLGQTGTVNQPLQGTENITPTKSTNPVGDMPLEARLGFAWFASPTFLWALDISYTSGVTNADKSIDPNGVRAPYAKDDVINLATGVEWYVMPAFPLRLGVFTNNDARPKLQKGTPDPSAGQTCANADYYKKYCGQPDHIDYVGESLFIAWVQPNSQISAGITLQQGAGQAEKLGDDQVQDVKSTQTQFAFSATHNL